MATNQQSDDSDFVCIGDYTPPEADRLLEALTTVQIPFDMECDDGISDQPNTSGTFGTNAYVSIFVPPDRRHAAEGIRDNLFGGRSP